MKAVISLFSKSGIQQEFENNVACNQSLFIFKKSNLLRKLCYIIC